MSTTETKAKRTPGPWLVTGENLQGRFFVICDNSAAPPLLLVRYSDNPLATRDKAEANAAFIVHACNLHDELVAGFKYIANDGALTLNEIRDIADALLSRCQQT